MFISTSVESLSKLPALLTIFIKWIAVQAKGIRYFPSLWQNCSAWLFSFSNFSLFCKTKLYTLYDYAQKKWIKGYFIINKETDWESSILVLTGVAQLVWPHPTKQKGTSSIRRICRFGQCFSLTSMFLSPLFVPPFPSLKKSINQSINQNYQQRWKNNVYLSKTLFLFLSLPIPAPAPSLTLSLSLPFSLKSLEISSGENLKNKNKK